MATARFNMLPGTFQHHAVAYALSAIILGGMSYLVHMLTRRRKAVTVPFVPAPKKQAIDSTYTDVFPPSQREALAEALPKKYGSAKELNLTESTPLLKLEDDYRVADPSLSIFSGFTVGDVKALGDFPDYAILSGVPLPSPAKEFNIDKAMPRPYRPFRWNYHQTMGHFKLDKDFWLELECTYRERISQRQDLYAKHGKHVLQALPGSELACKELMEISLQFLCARYPEQFQVEDGIFINRILQTKDDLATAEPLLVLLNNVPEDFALVLRDEATGRYVFRAGIICSAVGWNLGEKIGAEMLAIHGPVPDFKDKLAFSLDRFFTKMKASQPIQRASWGLEIGQPLFLQANTEEFALRDSQNPNLRPEDIYLRTDWQTLRRLPLSGAVCFNFKALFTPMTDFKDEPYVPALVHKVISEAKENILKYKGTWHVEHVAKPALAEYARWQVENGLVEKDWEVHTLDEAPFFPGWEKKWMDNGGVATAS